MIFARLRHNVIELDRTDLHRSAKDKYVLAGALVRVLSLPEKERVYVYAVKERVSFFTKSMNICLLAPLEALALATDDSVSLDPGIGEQDADNAHGSA